MLLGAKTATTMCKLLNGLVPEYLAALFKKHSTRNIRKLRSNETDLCYPFGKLTMGLGTVSFCRPSLCNHLESLEVEAKQAQSQLPILLRLLSIYLFSL